MQITVSYQVYYKKDCVFDLFYMGSPKYEVSIKNSDNYAKKRNDMPTSTSPCTETISYTARAVDIRDMKLILTFSTDNVQNIIYFQNITVNYRCYK